MAFITVTNKDMRTDSETLINSDRIVCINSMEHNGKPGSKILFDTDQELYVDESPADIKNAIQREAKHFSQYVSGK